MNKDIVALIIGKKISPERYSYVLLLSVCRYYYYYFYLFSKQYINVLICLKTEKKTCLKILIKTESNTGRPTQVKVCMFGCLLLNHVTNFEPF